MNNLTRYEHNGLELVINTETGECFASQSAIARMCGVYSQQISQFRGNNELVKTLQVKDSRGVIQNTKLYPERS